MVFDSVAGFNPKAVFVMLMELMECDVDPMHDIKAVLNAMFALEAFLVGADDSHLTTDGTILRTVEGVASRVTLAPHQQLPSPSSFASNHRRHEEGDVERLEPANHRHTVETPVKIKPFDPHSQGVKHG